MANILVSSRPLNILIGLPIVDLFAFAFFQALLELAIV